MEIFKHQKMGEKTNPKIEFFPSGKIKRETLFNPRGDILYIKTWNEANTKTEYKKYLDKKRFQYYEINYIPETICDNEDNCIFKMEF